LSLSRQIACRPLRLLFAGLLLATAGCAAEPTPYVERPVEEIYNDAMDRLGSGDYEAAAREFDEVERQHPYSIWATKAQLMAAYALYEAEKFDDAVIAIDRFIQLHPTNQDAPYAYYLKGLSYYAQISDVGRDQKITRLALSALEELVRRYPTSEYARDARLKIDLTQDHLAGKEMEIGRFYLRRDYLLAAINRFRVVVQDYQTTSHVPEALHRLVEAYEALGMSDQAARVAAVLGHNFPGSEWYVDTYELVEAPPQEPAGGGFFSRTWDEAFSGRKKIGLGPEEAKRLAVANAPSEPVVPANERGETRTVLRAPEGTTGGDGGESGWLSRQWGSVFGSDGSAPAARAPSAAPQQTRPAPAAPAATAAASPATDADKTDVADDGGQRPGWFSRQFAAVFGAEDGDVSEAEEQEAAEAESRRAAAEAQRQAAAAAEIATAAERRAAAAEAAARRTEEERAKKAREAAARVETLTAEAGNAAAERAKAQRAADYWSEQASSATAEAAVAEARANAEAAGKALVYWREAERYALAAADVERRRAGDLAAATPGTSRPEPAQAAAAPESSAPASPTPGSPILPPAERAGTEVVVPGRTPPGPAVTAAPLASAAAPSQSKSAADAWMRAREEALDRAPSRTAGPAVAATASRQASARMDDAYTTALAQAREEQKQAKAAMEYWAAAVTAGGTVPPRQAEENRQAAEQALTYWQERERVLQAWRQGRGAGERSAESAPSDGPGMFERAWRSIF